MYYSAIFPALRVQFFLRVPTRNYTRSFISARGALRAPLLCQPFSYRIALLPTVDNPRGTIVRTVSLRGQWQIECTSCQLSENRVSRFVYRLSCYANNQFLPLVYPFNLLPPSCPAPPPEGMLDAFVTSCRYRRKIIVIDDRNGWKGNKV